MSRIVGQILNIALATGAFAIAAAFLGVGVVMAFYGEGIPLWKRMLPWVIGGALFLVIASSLGTYALRLHRVRGRGHDIRAWRRRQPTSLT